MILFNGQDFDQLPYVFIRRIQRELMPPHELNILELPNMPGGYLLSKKDGILVTNVDIIVHGQDPETVRANIRELAGILHTEKPEKLIFKDEPDKYYYGITSGSISMDPIVNTESFTVQFICLDPYAYGEDLQVSFMDGKAVINYDGTKETFPIYQIQVNQPITLLEIRNQDDQFFRIGKEQTPNVEPYIREELVIHDTMASTANWTAGIMVDDGQISGEMVSDGTKFIVSDYGSGSRWHGPALKRTLDTPVQDFLVECWFTMDNSVNGHVGRVEVYLFDQNNNKVGKVQLADEHFSTRMAKMKAQAGNHTFVEYTGDIPGVWNRFDYGIMKIQRVGNVWMAHMGKISPDGRHHARHTVFWTDVFESHMNAISHIQIHMGKFADRQPTVNQAHQLKVYKINQPPAEQAAPYIADAGDVLDISPASWMVRRNGEPIPQAIDILSNKFPLKRGENIITVEPAEAVTGNVKFRKRHR